jgi:two-component system nitrogen regulation response regulator NtrX
LKNIVERMMIMVPGKVIEVANIPPAIAQAVEGGKENGGSASPADVRGFGDTYREAKEAFDRSYLRSQLVHNGWNISKTAETIGLERSNLHKKIKQLKIESGS